MNRRSVVLWGLVAVLLLGVGGVAAQEGEPIRIIFMHHSTGHNLIEQGGVREGLTALGYEFWDHGYNGDGLRDADGTYTGLNWDVPGDNTDPDGWYYTFNQPVTDPPGNTFSHMLEYDVIIFKSCFPSSNIYDESVFEAYRTYYLSIRDAVDQHPDRLFIAWTTPPLVPNETDPDTAARARRWAEYLTSDDYLAGHPNLVVFDVFNLWADEDGFLRAEYRSDEWDSHPNELANQTVGPIFVEFIDQAIRDFVPGEAPPPPPPVDEGEEEAAAEGEPEAVTAAPVETGLIDDFEGGNFGERWWTHLEGNATFTCLPEGPGHEGDYALHMSIESNADSYAACGIGGLDARGWADTTGLRFFWRSDAPGQVAEVVLSLENAVFVTELQTPDTAPDEWTEVTLLWEDMEGGVVEPTQIIGVSFDFASGAEPWRGSVWVDDLALIAAGGGAAVENFEGADVTGSFAERWWSYADEGGVFTCEPGQPAHAGNYALRLAFDLGAAVYAGCGTSFDGPQDWSGADGLSFYLRGDQAGVDVILTLLVHDPAQPDSPTPFDIFVQTEGEAWTPITALWADFVKPEWFGDAGAAALDPARVIGLAFNVGSWENPVSTVVWVDDLQLFQAE